VFKHNCTSCQTFPPSDGPNTLV